MDNDIKKEAKRQYLHYFRFWFIGIGILAVLCLVFGIAGMIRNNVPRSNSEAPSERVYDYADVLTDREEEDLREHIAEMEKKMHIDIVLLTINQSVEGEAAMKQYGYRSSDWEQNMQDIADDFWDENKYGYNRGFEGDGVLLLHNWYEGQNGMHLSTSGRVFERFGNYHINSVLDAVDYYYYQDENYKSYKAYVDEVCALMDDSVNVPFSWGTVFVAPVIAAVIYALWHLRQKNAKDTTAVNAYVAGGKPLLKNRTDDFVRKNVTRRRIQTSSSGGGGRSSGGRSGGGGSHRSRSGARHGGGSRRH